MQRKDKKNNKNLLLKDIKFKTLLSTLNLMKKMENKKKRNFFD